MSQRCPQIWRSSSTLGLAIAMGLVVSTHAQDAADLPLPSWSEEELQTMRGVPDAQAVPESMLWPPGMLDITPPVTVPWYLGEADSPDADQPHADVSLFLPPSLLHPFAAPFEPVVAMPVPPTQTVSQEFLRQAAEAPADVCFLDPGKVLRPAFRDDLTRFVESHARDARIKMYVLVLDSGQKLPAHVNLGGIAQGALENTEGCLLVYPSGDPWRARMFMSRRVSAAVPASDLAEVLNDARRDALQGMSHEEQMHRMLVRLSIRLFWLERLLDKPQETIARAIAAPAEVAALPEIGPAAQESGEGATPVSWRWVAAAFAAALAAWAGWRWRTYRLRHYEWVLPTPPDVKPRLGAPHCASGIWMSYR